jgi:hypothetical protein
MTNITKDVIEHQYQFPTINLSTMIKKKDLKIFEKALFVFFVIIFFCILEKSSTIYLKRREVRVVRGHVS